MQRADSLLETYPYGCRSPKPTEGLSAPSAPISGTAGVSTYRLTVSAQRETGTQHLAVISERETLLAVFVQAAIVTGQITGRVAYGQIQPVRG